jgi:GNAT superfamily N-acetyltransferase
MSPRDDDLQVVILNADHDLTLFHCDNQELENFLKQDALNNQYYFLSVTRLVFYHGRIVGYFTLVNDVIRKKEVIADDGEVDYHYTFYPALKIARFATHTDNQRQGIGRYMLLRVFAFWFRLSQYVGCRIITVDAKPEATGFYKKFGFREAIVSDKRLLDSIPMYIDIGKASGQRARSVELNQFVDKNK